MLHATPFLHDTLTNVRALLKPRGQLFLQELCPGKYAVFVLYVTRLTVCSDKCYEFHNGRCAAQSAFQFHPSDVIYVLQPTLTHALFKRRVCVI